MLRLVTGGSGSGKSAFAESLAASSEIRERYYIATMIPWDEECRARIRRHRAMRAGKGFATLEQPLDLDQIQLPADCAVLLECLSNLTANEYFREDRREPDPACWGRATEARILAGIRRLAECAAEVTVVTDDVFSGGLSYGGETEEYMKVLGNVNRRLAELAGEVTEVVFGIPVCLKKESAERSEKESAERAVSRGEGEQRCAGSEA